MTEITVVTGDHLSVEGEVRDIERIILDAARGSIMELAWVVRADTGERVGLNPEWVVMLRAAPS